ncbi:hypothetical protein [Halomonas sp. DWK9]|uniref:hypothetical protein n=1 Tax=Halomonas sp. DWK9 TaxID=3060155 RepID=UPI00287FB0E9|nr:hypothetical protein [Halomonas sp. DWK9]
MSNWKITGAGFYNPHGEAVYTVTNGCKRLDHRDHDELGKLLSDAKAIRESLRNLVGLAKQGAAPLSKYKAAIEQADQLLNK